MKRFLLAVVVSSFLTNFSSGQIEKPLTKGHLLLGGSISINSDNSKEYDHSGGSSTRTTYFTEEITFMTNLYCGYFISNQLALGIKTDISTSSLQQYSDFGGGESKFKYYKAGFGPFVRYYSKQGVYAETFASIGLNKNSGSNVSRSWKNYSYGIGVGYSLFVNPSIAIEPQIKYVHQSSPRYLDTNTDMKKNGINFSIGFQIFLNKIIQ